MNRQSARTRLLLSIAAAAAAVYFAGLALNVFWLRVVFKPVPAACLALWAWNGRPSRYARWIAVGLALSILGDLFMETGEKTFQLGVGSFLLAHLGYIAAFLSIDRRPRPHLAVPCIAWGAGAFSLVGGKLGPMR